MPHPHIVSIRRRMYSRIPSEYLGIGANTGQIASAEYFARWILWILSRREYMSETTSFLGANMTTLQRILWELSTPALDLSQITWLTVTSCQKHVIYSSHTPPSQNEAKSVLGNSKKCYGQSWYCSTIPYVMYVDDVTCPPSFFYRRNEFARVSSAILDTKRYESRCCRQFGNKIRWCRQFGYKKQVPSAIRMDGYKSRCCRQFRGGSTRGTLK